jgi:arylsulfatase A-like enzyme
MGSHNEFHKFSPYETMARVPLVIRSANIQPGEVDRLVSHLDLPPTLANIGKSPVDEKWRGKSVTIVDEKSATDRQILLGHETPEYVGGGLVRYPWKYVFRQKGFNGQMLTESLHHLERDPKEQTDYKSQEQGRFDTLQTQCEELLASIQKNRLCSDRAIWDDSRSSKEAEKGEERSDEELSKDIEEQLKKLGYK